MPSVGPRADPSVQAVSPQETISYPPSSRLPLLSARPAVTFPAAEHHRPLAGTKLYCLVTKAHRYEHWTTCPRLLCRVAPSRIEPTTYWSQVQRPTRCATTPGCYETLGSASRRASRDPATIQKLTYCCLLDICLPWTLLTTRLSQNGGSLPCRCASII